MISAEELKKITDLQRRRGMNSNSYKNWVEKNSLIFKEIEADILSVADSGYYTYFFKCKGDLKAWIYFFKNLGYVVSFDEKDTIKIVWDRVVLLR